MRFIDMFCGIGGFRLGLEKGGQDWEVANTEGLQPRGRQPNSANANRGTPLAFDCVWANDNDRYVCQVYRKHWGDGELYEGDIRAINPSTIPKHDLLCAGFPCQSFSIAGKRRGFEDTRGTLFFEICRVLRAKRPGYLFLENVRGLLSHDNGSTFETIIGTLDELGYDLQWQVLNSKDYGVPQNRERVFIVGHLRGKPRPKVFPISTDSEEIMVENEGYKFLCTVGAKEGVIEVQQSVCIDYVNYKGLGSNQPRMGVAELIDETAHIRRLTPLECERLQGFSDNWTSGISDTQRYKCLGNAVTVNVIEAIGRRLLET